MREIDRLRLLAKLWRLYESASDECSGLEFSDPEWGFSAGKVAGVLSAINLIDSSSAARAITSARLEGA